jgi:hypothetical protein
MRAFFLPLAFLLTVIYSLPTMAQDPPAACKPVKQYGVSGCELLPDHTCPPGYHKQVVDPPNPQMKAPSRLMCVPDKPSSEKPPVKEPPKSEAKPHS